MINGDTERWSCFNVDYSCSRPHAPQKNLMCLSPEAVMSPEMGRMGRPTERRHVRRLALRFTAYLDMKNSNLQKSSMSRAYRDVPNVVAKSSIVPD